MSGQQQQERNNNKKECMQPKETMMKIRAVIIFVIAQVALAKCNTSRRSADVVIEVDQAIRHNRNIVTISLSNSVASQLVANIWQKENWGLLILERKEGEKDSFVTKICCRRSIFF